MPRKTQQVTIVDYGMGNLHSVQKAMAHVADKSTRVLISHRVNDVKNADRIVLPGQGAIAGCMAHIHQAGLYDAIVDAALSKPFLAICVGPQLLMEHSAENGGVDGFAIFAGTCKRFNRDAWVTPGKQTLKIPHMGWNQLKQVKPHPLWQGIADNSYFYFVHSYYLAPKNTSDVVAQCDYGQTFDAALARDNIFTTQCHPEKSAENGLKLFENFLHWAI